MGQHPIPLPVRAPLGIDVDAVHGERPLAPGHEVAQQALDLLALTFAKALGRANLDPAFQLDVAGSHLRQLVEGAIPARQVAMLVVMLPGVQLGGQGMQPVAQPVFGN